MMAVVLSKESMVSRSRKPSPVRALFADVAPAASIETPAWMLKPEPGEGGTIPPETAAALLHATARKAASPAPDSSPLPEQSHRRIPIPRSVDLDEAMPASLPGLPPAPWQTQNDESWPSAESTVTTTLQAPPNLEELHAAISTLYRSKARLLEQMAPQVLDLVERIVGRLLASEEFFDTALCDRNLASRLVREGLRVLGNDGEVAAILGPGFSRQAEDLQANLELQGIQAEIQVHPHLPPYACQFQSDLGSVDESLEARLDKVLSAYLAKDKS